eukprot:gene22095-biopygen23681
MAGGLVTGGGGPPHTFIDRSGEPGRQHKQGTQYGRDTEELCPVPLPAVLRRRPTLGLRPRVNVARAYPRPQPGDRGANTWGMLFNTTVFSGGSTVRWRRPNRWFSRCNGKRQRSSDPKNVLRTRPTNKKTRDNRARQTKQQNDGPGNGPTRDGQRAMDKHGNGAWGGCYGLHRGDSDEQRL